MCVIISPHCWRVAIDTDEDREEWREDDIPRISVSSLICTSREDDGAEGRSIWWAVVTVEAELLGEMVL